MKKVLFIIVMLIMSVSVFSQTWARLGLRVGVGDSTVVIKSIVEDTVTNTLKFYGTNDSLLFTGSGSSLDTLNLSYRIDSINVKYDLDSIRTVGSLAQFYKGGVLLAAFDTVAMDARIVSLSDSISVKTDSITAHRAELAAHEDSIADHRTEINAHTDSIANHRSELDDAVQASEITAGLDALYVQDSMKLKNSEIAHFIGATQYYPDISGSMTMPAYWELLGSDVKAIPIGSELYVGGGITLADGEEFSMTYYLKDTTVITGARVTLSVQGGYTADNYNGIALYSNATGGLTLIDSTLNGAGDIWKAAAGATIDSTFAAGPHTLAPGLYTVSVIYNQSAQTAAPVAVGRSTLITTTQRFAFTNDRKLTGRVTGRTAPADIVHSSISSYSYCVQVVLY